MPSASPELGGCPPIYSAYIPGTATQGGIWRHPTAYKATQCQPRNRWSARVLAGDEERPRQDSNLRTRLRRLCPLNPLTCAYVRTREGWSVCGPCDPGFEPAASSSRSQLVMRTARTAVYL